MPSAVPQKRHAHEDDSDHDHDDSPPLSSPASSTAPSKRVRVNGHTGGHLSRQSTAERDGDEEGEVESEDEDGDGEDVEEGFEGGALPEADINAHDDAEVLEEEYDLSEPTSNVFQPGAIVRIKLHNFVTYSDVEIFPGPSLNMIVGPNGTGKSTIICAICLGLGWNASHLGRAKEPVAFVKHRASEATIEIELQGREGERNPVFKRKIVREGGGSSWFINGKPSNGTKVMNLAKSYNVQIDNLCQFLPQDRVGEFARMANTDRLTETQRAAAGPEMLTMHKQLIKLWNEVAGESTELNNDQAQLQQLETRQAVLQHDVDRLRERQDIQKNIDLLKLILPYIQYTEYKKEYTEAKSAVKRGEQELARLQADIGPAMKKPEQKKIYKEKMQQAIRDRQEELTELESGVAHHKNTVIAKLVNSIKDVTDDMEQEHRKERKRRDEVRALQKKVEEGKKRTRNGPPEFDLAPINEEILKKGRGTRELGTQADDIKAASDIDRQNIAVLRSKIEAKQEDLKRLDSLSGQREALFSREADAWTAWQWYQDNKQLFDHEIYPPPILSVKIKDQQLTDMIETLIRNSAFIFMCQSTKDYNTFISGIFGNRQTGEQGLGLSNVTVRDYETASDMLHQQQPASQEQLSRLGFEGYALDFIDAPDPILNMLCHEHSIHSIPVARRDISEEANKRCEASGLSLWGSGRSIYSVRRRYGAISTSVNPVIRAKLFKSQTADPEKKREIERQISELRYQFDELQNDLKEKVAEYKTISEKKAKLVAEIEGHNAEKSRLQNSLSSYRRIVAMLEQNEERLNDITKSADEYKENMAKLKQKLAKLSMDRAQAAIDFAAKVQNQVDAHNALIQLRIRFIEAASDEKNLLEKTSHLQSRLDEKANEITQLRRKKSRLEERAKEKRVALNDLYSDLTQEETRTLRDKAEGKSTADVEEEIDTENARLGLIHEGNPHAIKQYEERQLKILGLQKKIESMKEKLAGQHDGIREVRNKWEPALDALVAKISSAFTKSFQKIGCAGEVRVHKSEEGFDKWAIEIMVKFREKERLQVLDNHRQSGGERSVSTVFYLMALQSLAKSPFRVVDEINQGMDPRNERVVHHRMVNIACQEHTSQYFLITPKLLSDLMYHPRMKVHCIYSGDWIYNHAIDYGKLLALGRGAPKREEVESDSE